MTKSLVVNGLSMNIHTESLAHFNEDWLGWPDVPSRCVACGEVRPLLYDTVCRECEWGAQNWRQAPEFDPNASWRKGQVGADTSFEDGMLAEYEASKMVQGIECAEAEWYHFCTL